MKKFTEKQILEGFRTWEQDMRDNSEKFMSCYESFQRGVDENAVGLTKSLLKYIEKAGV